MIVNRRRRPRGAVLATVALLGSACASSPMRRPDEPLIEAPAVAPTPVPVAAPVLPPEPPAGTIRRDELLRVLAASPGAFLAHVDVEPVVVGAAFRGWRLRSFFAGDPRLGAALRPGDVVLRVNDRSVERPEQFMEVWQAAAARADLTVDLLRDQRPTRLAWRIIDGR